MKHQTFTLWLAAILMVGSLQAQTFSSNTSSSSTVWTVKGKVHYTERGSSKQVPILPGMSLKDDVSVNLAENSSIRMAQNDLLISLSEKGEYYMGSDLKKYTAKQSAATAGFFDLLTASTKFYGTRINATDGSGYGDGTKKTADGSGYGDGSKKVADGSGYGDGSKKVADGSGYGDGSKKVADGSGYGDGSKKTADGSGYGDGSKKAADGSGYGSKKAAKAKKKAALSPLKSDKLYKECKKPQKLLMKAAILDKAGLMPEAKKYYKKALSKNSNDPLSNQMYVAFLNR